MYFGMGLRFARTGPQRYGGVARLFSRGEQGVWYDPSDTTTLFQDSAGTTPVTASGQPVGLMLDKSGRGNHATQPTAASRPIYRRGDSRGVVNLLTWSEDFSNAAWVKINGATVGTNVAVAPDATMTADSITFASQANSRVERQVPVQGGVKYTASCYARVASGVATRRFGVSGGIPGQYSDVVLSDVWQRFSVTITADPSLEYPVWSNNNDSAPGTIYVWGFQINLGTTALPYQRNDSHLGGVATGASTDLHWLETDGVDDGMVTGNIDFTGTDKVAIFAGVRKLSDAATGIFCELGTDAATVNNSFGMFAPASSGANSYRFGSRGKAAAFAGSGVFAAAPNTSVVTGIGNISGDSVSLRTNAVLREVSGEDQGTGNYGNYPLYLFRRGGTLLPFNGWFYGMTITGRLTTDAETVATERFLSAKSAVVIP